MRINIWIAAAAMTTVTFAANPAVAVDREKLQEAYAAIESLDDASALEDPADIMAWVEMPRAVKLGETFDITVTIENGRTDRVLKMNAVDVNDGLLEGIELVAVKPDPRSAEHYADGYIRLEFPIDVEPGQTWQVVITARARQTGIYIDDIDVLEGQQILSRSAQIRIR